MSDSIRKRERREEIEVYLSLPSIRPPTIGNPKAYKTNRLWAQVEVKPNSHIFWVHTSFILLCWTCSSDFLGINSWKAKHDLQFNKLLNVCSNLRNSPNGFLLCCLSFNSQDLVVLNCSYHIVPKHLWIF